VSAKGSVPSDAALAQYTCAVRETNKLLSEAKKEEKKKKKKKKSKYNGFIIAKILILCIIFTCFENLAGNYKAVNMHLRNGLCILKQYRNEAMPNHSGTPTTITVTQASIQHAVANVLLRFDLQAITFSDDTSPYEWHLNAAPKVPYIPAEGDCSSNEAARDDLVGLSRCMLWVAGILDKEAQVAGKKEFKEMYEGMVRGLGVWQGRFGRFEKKSERGRGGEEANVGKIYEAVTKYGRNEERARASRTLLRVYAIIMRTVAAAGAGLTSEMAWDDYIEDSREVVELAETLPMLQPRPQPYASSSTSPSPSPSPPPPQPSTLTSPTPSPPRHLTIIFHSNTTYPVSTHTIYPPSFELSPIVPLFLIATRCRDPLVRRRALRLLLNYRRREGVWESLAVGMVTAEVLKQEEGIQDAEIGEGNWVGRASGVERAGDVPESRRLGDLFVRVGMREGGGGLSK
jgi:hypothetical protein